MNELKPEDVMRALEYCKDCKANINIDIENLIRKQTAEIEVLKAEGENYKEWYFKAVEELRQYKFGNIYEALLREKDVEIERLKKLHEGFATKFKAEFKADAISEFAERLKGRFNMCASAMYSETTVHSVITKVIKEMEETLRENNDC